MQLKDRFEFGHLFNKLKFTGNGAEIGVQRGDFSSIIRNTWETGKIHLIDRWSYEEDYNDVARLSYREQLNNYLYVVNRFAEDFSMHIYRMDSVEASRHFPDGYFDWIYIDADHSYNGCKRDLESWYPKLKKGGLFCGHDYLNGIIPAGDFGVKSAVDEFISGKNVKLFVTQEYEWKSWYFVNDPSFEPATVILPNNTFSDEKVTDRNIVDKLLFEAELMIEKGEYEKSKEKLNEILISEPNNLNALNDLSVILILENEFENAEALIKKILDYDNNNEVAIGNYQYLIENRSNKQ